MTAVFLMSEVPCNFQNILQLTSGSILLRSQRLFTNMMKLPNTVVLLQVQTSVENQRHFSDCFKT